MQDINHYPFEVKSLSYAYDGLEPYIDEETMHLHHDKHYAGYVTKLNDALAMYPDYQHDSLESLLRSIPQLPESLKTPVQNFGGGVYNHELYFDNLSGERQQPSERMKQIISDSFGSMEAWELAIKDVGMSQFGSGYVWMTVDENEELHLIPTLNQNTPDLNKMYPILVIDLWEHAYYLKYNNRRDDYLNNIGYLINWKEVENRYDYATK